jgi:predicted PurR-regulated permease PerM
MKESGKKSKNRSVDVHLGDNKIYIKIFILVVAILIVGRIVSDFGWLSGAFSTVWSVISPFVFGFIIAYCINIPVHWLELKLKLIKWRWMEKGARPISIIANLVGLIGFIVFGMWSLIPMIVDNVVQLIEAMPGYLETGMRALSNMPFAEELEVEKRFGEINFESYLQQLLPEPSEAVGMATGLFSVAFSVFLTIVATLYFLVEYNKVKDFVKRFIKAHSPRRQKPAIKYLRLVDVSFRRFLTCQFLDSLILGTITLVFFTIIRTPHAVTLGLLLGVLNIIPYFGSIFGSMVAVFIIWATSGIDVAIVVAISLLIIQQIDGNFINPKIMGTSFKISPVVVIIAITIGGAIGGVLGMIFAIPVVNVLKTVLEEYIQSKEKQRAEQRAELAAAQLACGVDN